RAPRGHREGAPAGARAPSRPLVLGWPALRSRMTGPFVSQVAGLLEGRPPPEDAGEGRRDLLGEVAVAGAARQGARVDEVARLRFAGVAAVAALDLAEPAHQGGRAAGRAAV